MNSIAVYERDSSELKVECETKPNVSVVSSSKNPVKNEYVESILGKWSFHSRMIEEHSNFLIPENGSKITSHSMRKKFFSKLEKRNEVIFRPELVYCMDFYDAYVDVSTCSIKLPGFSLNGFKYWDGQPLRYSVTTRDRNILFFVVQFELVEKIKYQI